RRGDGGARARRGGHREVRRRLSRRDPAQRRVLPGRAGDPVRPAVVLVGVMGAGKTTVGTLVADALGLPFRDTDDDIVAATGKPISDIFVDDGEDHFRALERQAVAAALDGFDGVLALGGGAVMAAETRERLTGHR